jgi:DnaJ-class molecular chaperone
MDKTVGRQTCAACKGTGKRNGWKCDICNGSGKVSISEKKPEADPSAGK